jgi:hypothetical protein
MDIVTVVDGVLLVLTGVFSSLPQPGIEPRSPGGPDRSQTLHWLSYSSSMNVYWLVVFGDNESPATAHTPQFARSTSSELYFVFNLFT